MKRYKIKMVRGTNLFGYITYENYYMFANTFSLPLKLIFAKLFFDDYYFVEVKE